MRWLVAPNAFKGSLSAIQAAQAIRRGVLKAFPAPHPILLPLSDGGPGLLDCLQAGMGGRIQRASISFPIRGSRKKLRAKWLRLPDGRAVVESAEAVGLHLFGKAPKPLQAMTAPLGQLLLIVAATKPREILLGLGGSGTTDGGTGMANALGWRFLDNTGRDLAPGGCPLRRLAKVVPGRPLGAKITVLCDVSNPLAGPQGAARIFAPQKGATAAEVKILDQGLKRLARQVSPKLAQKRGAGAAGGLGFGLMAFCKANLMPGAETVLRWIGFEAKLEACDGVISGEGNLDSQSLSGKLPYVVLQAARKAGKPCVLLAGKVEDESSWERLGATTRSIRPGRKSASYSINHAAELLEDEAYHILKKR